MRNYFWLQTLLFLVNLSIVWDLSWDVDITGAFFQEKLCKHLDLISFNVTADLVSDFLPVMYTVSESPLVWGKMQEHIKCQVHMKKRLSERMCFWGRSFCWPVLCVVMAFCRALIFQLVFSLVHQLVTFVMVRAHWSGPLCSPPPRKFRNSSNIFGQ